MKRGFATALGLIIFALFAHQGLPLILISGIGLGTAAVAIHRSLRDAPSAREALGLGRVPTVPILAGGLLGLLLGGAYHLWAGEPIWPVRLTGFAIVAGAIGATEEVLHRGYLQGALRPAGLPGAVVLTALAHTGYKTALFALHGGDLAHLAIWTFLGGVAFGLLKEWGGSVLPPLTAHACFDVIVYGDRIWAPWWVWS